MKLKNIDHLVVTTSSLEACLHFYADILGMNHRVVDGQHILEFGREKINIISKQKHQLNSPLAFLYNTR